MSDLERMTITVPMEVAEAVRGAVDGGEYASSTEVVREALGDWTRKRALQTEALAVLKSDVARGLTDVAEGRVRDFDAARVVERGRTSLAGRLPFA